MSTGNFHVVEERQDDVQPRLAPTLALGSAAEDTGPCRPTLQKRVQNALRWKSWGGEQATLSLINSSKGSTIRSTDWAASSAEPHQQRHRVGHSVGSDVELSSISGGCIPLTYSEGPFAADRESLPSPRAEAAKTAGSCGVSRRSSASSSIAANHENSSSHPSESANPSAHGLVHPGSAPALNTDDMCSVATQAGSRSHSFTSLYSMMTDQGDQGSDAGFSTTGPGAAGPGAAREGSVCARPSAAAGAQGVIASTSQSLVLSYRGSDTGADEKASVSTLPLISETVFDEEQLLDDVQHLTAEQVANVQGFAEDQEDYNPLQSIAGRPRVSSSHGSIGSSISDLSTAAAAGSGSARMPSSSYAAHTRSMHGSGRSSSRSAHSHHHQQDEGLPVPFSTRKRPENDETCSYATQAGSVHSVSSIMSSAFVDSSTPQRAHIHPAAGDSLTTGRLSCPGQQQQQQYPIHPLSEPDELEYYEGVSSQGDVDVNDFGVPSGPISSGEADSSTAVAPASAGLLDDGVEGLSAGSSLSPGGGPKGQHKDHEQQQGHHQHHQPDRVNSLRGALRSVVAWGSGLGQRLQRVGGTAQQQQQQQSSRQEQHLVKAAGAGSSRAQKGSSSSQEMANF